jgi:hypothetical protein
MTKWRGPCREELIQIRERIEAALIVADNRSPPATPKGVRIQIQRVANRLCSHRIAVTLPASAFFQI